jgi:hypothetical protein
MALQQSFSCFSRLGLVGVWLGLAILILVHDMRAQTAKPDAKQEPDVLIFTDDEKLIGHLVRSTGASVTFKSDTAGEITVEWSKIRELRTKQPARPSPAQRVLYAPFPRKTGWTARSHHARFQRFLRQADAVKNAGP